MTRFPVLTLSLALAATGVTSTLPRTLPAQAASAASIAEPVLPAISVSGANLPVGVAQGTATDRFKALTDAVKLPPGVRIAEAGDAEVQAELMVSFFNAMVMGLMFVLTVLILLFGSVIQPFCHPVVAVAGDRWGGGGADPDRVGASAALWCPPCSAWWWCRRSI